MKNASQYIVKIILLTLLGLAVRNAALAQGWERPYLSQMDQGRSIEPTPDGGFIVTGLRFPTTGQTTSLLRLDALGDTLWHRDLSGLLGLDLKVLPDGGFIIAEENPPGINLVRTDKMGNILWVKNYPVNHIDISLCTTQDNGFAVATRRASNPVPYVFRTDSLGDTLWTQSYGWLPLSTNVHEIQQTLDGGFVFSGHVPNVSPNRLYVVRTDSIGDTLWTRSFLGNYSEKSFLAPLDNGGYILSGTRTVPPSNAKDIYLMRLNQNGDSLWQVTWGGAQSDVSSGVLALADGGFLVGGISQSLGNGISDGIAIRTDSLGNTVWQKVFGTSGDEIFQGCASTLSGGFIFVGYTYGYFQSNDYDLYVVRTDGNGNTVSNLVEGKIFADQNGDCLQDPSDLNLEGWMVVAQGKDTVYAISDSLGNYKMGLDTGAYNVSVILPNGLWQAPGCSQASFQVNFTSFYDTVGIDFPQEPAYLCPGLQVDVSTPFLRRCSTNTYQVQYCNQGPVSANAAYIILEIDTFLTVLNSSIPWQTPQNDNIYRFNLGNIPTGNCGTFSFTTEVSCNALLGQAHCVTAHIYPDSICTPVSPLWDGSSIAVEAECLTQDSIQLTIFNQGANDMLVAGGYVIIEDNIMKKQGSFNLLAGQDLSWIYLADGATWTIEADQSPFHPGNQRPIITMEGCGTDSTGNFSTGILTTLPHNDGDPTISIDCQMNIGSYDPNDKRVYPAGIDTAHYITQREELEYLIRFQNTGTDTAFFVAVRDTLSPFLDITTVRPGASSHPYIFNINSNRELEFKFYNIALPDSFVDETGSIGFIKFKVAQTPLNAPGTRIENRVGIYFDYNAPVLTNTAFNTLRDSLWILINRDQEFELSQQLLVYPNPMQESATFVLGSKVWNQVALEIFDLSGRRLRREEYGAVDAFRFQREGLGTGIYLFRISSADRALASGKIVVH